MSLQYWLTRCDLNKAIVLAGLSVAALSLKGIIAYEVSTSPWAATVTLRHLGASPSCSAARSLGLAPALEGEPGYYRKHDRDGDGIA